MTDQELIKNSAREIKDPSASDGGIENMVVPDDFAGISRQIEREKEYRLLLEYPHYSNFYLAKKHGVKESHVKFIGQHHKIHKSPTRYANLSKGITQIRNSNFVKNLKQAQESAEKPLKKCKDSIKPNKKSKGAQLIIAEDIDQKELPYRYFERDGKQYIIIKAIKAELEIRSGKTPEEVYQTYVNRTSFSKKFEQEAAI